MTNHFCNYFNSSIVSRVLTKMLKTYKKLSVIEKTTDFSKAVIIAETPLVPPQAKQVLIKVVYVGVNPTDIQSSAGLLPQYASYGEVPFDIGIEVNKITYSNFHVILSQN